jgi:predicted DsbA family dithiol-disulfide isomerase
VRTARIARDYDVEIRTTLFPLHPDTPVEGLPLEELFEGRVDLDASHERMSRLMAEEGLPFARRSHTYNSRKAQEMAKWAERLPGGELIHEALYRAYFVDGANLADVERLVRIADSLGLPRDDARRAVESGDYADPVDQDWLRSRRFGVTAVPTFVVGGRGVVGAHPYEVLERLVREGGAEPRP